jgi:ABC-type phosphate transport system substrate-binding protein
MSPATQMNLRTSIQSLLMAGLCLAMLFATIVPANALVTNDCSGRNIAAKGSTLAYQAIINVNNAWTLAPTACQGLGQHPSFSYCATGSGVGQDAFLGIQGAAAAFRINQCTTNGVNAINHPFPRIAPPAVDGAACAAAPGANDGTVECQTSSTFSFSDAPLNHAQWASGSGNIRQYPWLVGAVAVVYDACGITSGLDIDAAAIQGIYDGTITTWTGLAIAVPQQNPTIASALTACSTPIVPIIRGDSSGTTYAFTDYLNQALGAGKRFNGPAPNKAFATLPATCTSGALLSATNPTRTGGFAGSHALAADTLLGCGNPGVNAVIKGFAANKGNFGYMDLSDTLKDGLSFAFVKANAPAGAVYQPPAVPSVAQSPANCQDAVGRDESTGSAAATPQPNQGFSSFSLVWPATGGYPICTYTYIESYENRAAAPSQYQLDWTCSDFSAANSWILFAVSPAGAAIAGTTPGFLPPNPVVQAQNVASAAGMTCGYGTGLVGGVPAVGGTVCVVLATLASVLVAVPVVGPALAALVNSLC